MKLLRYAAFLLMALWASATHAGDYGSLRISVSQVNPNHRTNVQLRLNGRDFAAFSHSLSSPITRNVTDGYLAKGTSTPMSSDYGGLQADCRFSFLIEYTFDGAFWISLGSFEAPASQVSGALPIGLCKGTLCSSNPSIRAKLEQIENERWKKAGEALRRWLQEAVDREAREARSQKEKLEAQKPPALEAGRLGDDLNALREGADMASVDVDLAPTVPDADSWWSNRIDAAVAAGGIEGLVGELDSLERFYQACSGMGAQAQLYCARYGGAAAFVAMAEGLAVAYAADPESALAALQQRQQSMQTGPTLADARDRVAQQRFQLQAAIDAKRSEATWRQVGMAARAGVGLSPLNDVADFCEALTGREFCVPSGRSLSREERLFAVLGVIAGNRQLWDALGDALRAKILDPSANPKVLADILQQVARNSDFSAKGATHIFVGEFESQSGKTFLRSGMHTEDSVQLFVEQARSEGRALVLVDQSSVADMLAVGAQGLARADDKVFRFEGGNGVSIYMFPRSSFLTDTSWERNWVEFEHAGKKIEVQGAKTVFPKSWDHNKSSEAMAKVRDLDNAAGPVKTGAVDGVTMRVVVDQSGKIVSGYPKIALPE